MLTRKNVVSAVLIGVMSIFLFGCGGNDDIFSQKVEVKLTAAFAKIQSAIIYDQDGRIVQKLKNGERVARLRSGTYYADIRDKLGNSVYKNDGRLMFAVKASGAKLILRPYKISGISIPLVALEVNSDGINFQKHALYEGAPEGDRGLLLWQATRAVVGSDDADDEDWSPAGTMYATASYVSTDTGAWNSMLDAYEGYACCVDDDLDPCELTYPCSTVLFYECQNGSCTNNYHGGQCKAFQNLIAYRSSIFHGENWAWKTTPTYSWISSNCDNITSGTIQAGDLLVYPYYHAMIVARVFSSTSVMVIDSNWIGGGDGYELVGAHEMSFSGSGISDLDNYKVLDCVYDNDCSSSCN